MTATETETIGIGQNAIVAMDKSKDVLEKGGMNVTVTKATVTLVVEDAKAANAQQESLKAQLKAQTVLTEAKMHHAYVVVSGAIDMMMAAVEKNSPQAKIFQRMRSKIKRANDGTAAQPLPVPAPEATQ